LDYGVALAEFSDEQARGKRDAKRDSDLDLDIALAKLVPRTPEIRRLAESRHLISENNRRALSKLEAGRLNLTKTEKNSLKNLLERLEIEL
jgi:hypothetical protein